MPYADIDLNLTDEQIAMRDMIKKFGAEVMRPAGIELDKLVDPADVIADGSILWDVFKQHRELGLHTTGFSKAFGGMAEEMDPMMGILMLEELAYADAGLAISLGCASMPFVFCQMVPGLQDLARQFVEDKDCGLVGCWGITEPDHGGDWSLGGDKPECGPSLKGVLKGDEYILNGQKSAWVSNGTIATHSVLHIGLDPSRGMQGQGIAICPLDLPGISKGKPLDKIGQRALNQGEIFFEDVHLPKEYMLITPAPADAAGGEGGMFSGANAPMGSMAVMFGGLAKAALDEAIKYSKDRIQGGVPIFEHKNIKLKLFEMFMMTESARSLSRRLQLFNSMSGGSSMVHTMAGKWMSTETAFKVASEAIQIFGGNGLSKEYVIEKLFRDARAAMIEDGTNEVLALSVVDGL